MRTRARIRQLRGRLKDGPPARASDASPDRDPPGPAPAQSLADAGQAGEGGMGGAVRLVGKLLGIRLWSAERSQKDGAQPNSESDSDQDKEQVGGGQGF